MHARRIIVGHNSPKPELSPHSYKAVNRSPEILGCSDPGRRYRSVDDVGTSVSAMLWETHTRHIERHSRRRRYERYYRIC
jgi:hypothetical protein